MNAEADALGPPTPALVVDEAVFEANLRAASEMTGGAKRLRPHFKTHKTPELALRQIAWPEVIGFACATVGEMEVLADAGVENLLLANEVVSSDKAARLANLACRARVIVAVDHPAQVVALSARAREASTDLGVLIDVDIGLGRCGLSRDSDLLDLARLVQSSPAVRVLGIMGYEGRIRRSVRDRLEVIQRAHARLGAVKALLRADGHDVDIVSGAGTSTLCEALADPSLTEIQVGTYALMETDLNDLGLPFRNAACVVATVISTAGNRIVVDAGRKAVGCEYGLPEVIGAPCKAISISEEHTVLECAGCVPEPGTKVSLRPSQIRTTFNLHDRAWLLSVDGSMKEMKITARGHF